MFVKVILALCAQALFVQTAFSQCLGAPFGWAGPAIAPFLGYDRFAAPFSYDRFAGPFGYDGLAPWAGRGLYDATYAPAIDITPTSSGGLIVTSSSPVPPTGISVISENAYEGILAVAGEVPFVGTTGMEGIVPTAGAAAVSHACGNGINAMVSDNTVYASEGIASVAFAPAAYAPAAYAPAAYAPLAYAPAYTDCGCGHVH